jgi:hypothetical protein
MAGGGGQEEELLHRHRKTERVKIMQLSRGRVANIVFEMYLLWLNIFSPSLDRRVLFDFQ